MEYQKTFKKGDVVLVRCFGNDKMAVIEQRGEWVTLRYPHGSRYEEDLIEQKQTGAGEWIDVIEQRRYEEVFEVRSSEIVSVIHRVNERRERRERKSRR